MTITIDIRGLNSEQIEQLRSLADAFRIQNELNNEKKIENSADFDPTPLFFESEILEPFNRSMLYGNRT